jgi:hypothetical protein
MDFARRIRPDNCGLNFEVASGDSGRFFYGLGINGCRKDIGRMHKEMSGTEYRRKSVSADKRRMTEAVAYNALCLAIHAAGGFHTGDVAAFFIMRLFLATAARLHRIAAVATPHGTGIVSCPSGQGQGEVEYAEKQQHDERNYFLFAPLHSAFFYWIGTVLMLHDYRKICTHQAPLLGQGEVCQREGVVCLINEILYYHLPPRPSATLPETGGELCETAPSYSQTGPFLWYNIWKNNTLPGPGRPAEEWKE